MRTSHSGPAAMLAISLLIGGACSVSTSSDGETSADDSADSTDSAPDVSGAPTHGVTDDTIKLGVAPIDAAAVLADFGVDIGTLPDGVFEALVEGVNAEGGINGRQVELVSRPFRPVGDEESEASCRELTEDEQVFAVVGMYIGENPLCVTEANSTPYIGLWGLDEERQERSKAPFISMAGPNGAALRSTADMLVDEDLLEGAKVAVYYEPSESEALTEANLIEPLQEAGVDIVSTAMLPDSDDQVQAGTDIDRIFQRFEADGADTVVFYSSAGVVLPALERTSWEPQLIFTNNGQFIGEDSLARYGMTDPAELAGAYLAARGNIPEELIDDPDLLACLDTINEYSDLDLTPEDTYPKSIRPESEGADLVPGVCQLWQLTTQVLTAAGDDPSPQSMVDGLAELDSFTLPGVPEASLAPDRWGATDATRLWTYDQAEAKFVPDGPVVTGE